MTCTSVSNETDIYTRYISRSLEVTLEQQLSLTLLNLQQMAEYNFERDIQRKKLIKL